MRVIVGVKDERSSEDHLSARVKLQPLIPLGKQSTHCPLPTTLE